MKSRELNVFARFLADASDLAEGVTETRRAVVTDGRYLLLESHGIQWTTGDIIRCAKVMGYPVVDITVQVTAVEIEEEE